ncbi:unnamed protein product [Cercospora beticola]|nr:unnamed protein product [Cercospora beticola]
MEDLANDSYWRFDEYRYGSEEEGELDEFLRRSGYYCPKDWSRDQMLSVGRMQWTSRPEYRYVERDDLLKFAEACKTLEDPEKATDAQLRASLVEADASPKFHKWGDLVPELRGRVYDYYFSNFPDVVWPRCTQPPLARLSKLMRAEVLPPFYKSTRFELDFLFKGPAKGQTEPRVAIAHEALLFLLNLRAEDFAYLRKFRIHIDDRSRDDGREPWATLDVTMTSDKSTPVVFQSEVVGYWPLSVLECSEGRRRTHEGYARLEDCQEQLLQDIEAAISDSLGPDKLGKLKLEDVTAIVQKIKNTCRDTAERIKWW